MCCLRIVNKYAGCRDELFVVQYFFCSFICGTEKTRTCSFHDVVRTVNIDYGPLSEFMATKSKFIEIFLFIFFGKEGACFVFYLLNV